MLPLGGGNIACWRNENAGTCLTNSLYRFLNSSLLGPHMPWFKLWNLPLPSKIKLFLWKGLQNRLLLWALLQKFIQSINPSCVLSHHQPETIGHLFCSCTATNNLWQSLERSHLIDKKPQTPLNSWFWHQPPDTQVMLA